MNSKIKFELNKQNADYMNSKMQFKTVAWFYEWSLILSNPFKSYAIFLDMLHKIIKLKYIILSLCHKQIFQLRN